MLQMEQDTAVAEAIAAFCSTRPVGVGGRSRSM
jgi:hypothetical protein